MPIRRAYSISAILGIVVFTGAALTLIGWAAKIPELRDWSGSGINMKANDAISTICAGLAVILLSVPHGPRWLVRAFALVPLAFGLGTLLQHFFGTSFGIDMLFFREPPGALGTMSPGRMGIPASTAITLCGLGLIFASTERPRLRSAAALMAILVSALTMVSIGGYILGADELYGMPRITAISTQMAVLLFALGLALIVLLPDREPMQTIVSSGAAGLLVRRALPVILLVPFGLAWLVLIGEDRVLFDAGAGRAIVIVALVGLLCILLAKVAKTIKAYERAVRESQESFEIAFAASPDAVVITKVEDGEIRQANESFAGLVGLEPGSLIGRRALDLGIYPNDVDSIAALRRLKAEGRLRDYEMELVRGTGERISVHSSAEPIEIAGEPYLLTIIRDVTESRRTQEALRESEQRLRSMNEELERRVGVRTADLLEANEQLNGFTYSVAHDLRQSIRGIVMNARLIQEDYADRFGPEGMEGLERLSAAGRRMSELVDDLLKYARISKQEPRKQMVDLSAIASSVGEDLCDQYPSAIFKVAPGLTCFGEAALIRLALENLIENACKYVVPGAQPHVRVGSDGNAFFVADRGIGFEPQYANRIFQPFERLHAGNRYPGTGIGLANVRRVIEKHGGEVWAESAPGKGSTFWFTIPGSEDSAARSTGPSVGAPAAAKIM